MINLGYPATRQQSYYGLFSQAALRRKILETLIGIRPHNQFIDRRISYILHHIIVLGIKRNLERKNGIKSVEFSIDPKDLQIDTFRSSGAGGQHVNKTESAIRITHLPTGVVVECQDERSQYKNKDRAMKILRSKLYEAEQEKQNAAIAATRKSQVGTGDRSGKIRTYNFPQNRVTDHRLTGDNKNFNIAAIINGDLDGMIDALTLNDQAQRLQEGKES